MSNNILVGRKDCQITTILELLKQENYFGLLFKKWPEIAIELHIPNVDYQKLQDDFKENLTLTQVMDKIIRSWLGREGSNATLLKLIQSFENTSLNAYGELLRLRFNLPCEGSEKPSFSWDKLSNSFKQKVTENLKEFWKDVELNTESMSLLPRAILLDLMTGKRSAVFRKTITEELKYYLPRTLITRNVLTNGIFELSSETFLVSGMEIDELNEYLQMGHCEYSSSQLKNRDKDVHFIILNQLSHFDKIDSDDPVHHIKFETDKFRWVRSRGGLGNIKRYLHLSQQYLFENEFLERMSSLTDSNSAVCISDSPGMGKSVLSKQISNKLKTLQPERIVAFQEFPDFINALKNTNDQPLLKVFENVLLNLICEHELEKAIFKSKFKSKEVSIELILDGYDELSKTSFEFADEFLTIAKSQTSTRMWITTRPHLLEKLENILGVLGYNIQAFTEQDQTKFLTSFWAKNPSRPLSTERLTEFATECLKKLKSTISAKEIDIAGIPLQCRMIGEVYEHEATEYSQRDSMISDTKIIVSSITDLYQRTIDAKIAIYNSTSRNLKLTEMDLLNMHVPMSLELTFPMHYKEMTPMFKKAEIDDMLNVGIVEYAGTKPTFIHKTFAEYFVARFVARNLSEFSLGNDWNVKLNDLFFKGLLGNVVKIGIYSYEFDNPVVCFFLNSFLSNSIIISRNSDLKNFLKTLDNPETIRPIAYACANGNFWHIFDMFKQLDGFKIHDKTIFTSAFLLNTVKKSDLQFVKTAISQFENHSEVHKRLQITLLRMAVKRGGFPLITFLLQVKNLRWIVEDTPKLKILHWCVQSSKDNSEDVIEGKILVIKHLCKINPSILEEENKTKQTPLLCKDIHIKLLLRLIEFGANVLSSINKNIVDTVLHITYLTPDEYLQLLETITIENVKKLVHVKGLELDTPLFRLIRYTEPNDKTLDIFATANADFNVCNNFAKSFVSLLALAIIKGRSTKTIKKLIEKGAHVGWTSQEGWSLLHLEARSYVGLIQFESRGEFIKRIKLLIEHGADVNKKDNNGYLFLDHIFNLRHTPTSAEFHDIVKSMVLKIKNFENGACNPLFTLALKNIIMEEKTLSLLKVTGVNFASLESDVTSLLDCSIRNRGDKESLSSLIRFGADINWTGKSGESLLHVAVQYGDLNVIELLLDNHLSVNALDIDNETPLHYVAKYQRSSSRKISWDSIGALIDNTADAHVTNTIGQTYLHILFEWPLFDKIESTHVEYLIEKNQANLFNVQDKNGATPLHLVQKKYHIGRNTLSRLHEQGVKFHLIDNDGNSVLTYSVIGGQKTDILFAINQFGADVKQLNKSLRSLLHVAAEYSRLNATKFCIKLHLDVNGEDSSGNTPLHLVMMATKGKSDYGTELEIAKILVDNGANIDLKNNYGFTPFETVKNCTPFHTEILKVLRRRVDVEQETNMRDDNTQLHIAVKHGNIKRIEKLMEKFVNVNAQNRNSDTSLHMAANKQDSSTGVKIIIILLENGADPTLRNTNGCTFLHIFQAKDFNVLPSEFHDLVVCLVRKNYAKLLETRGWSMQSTPIQSALLNITVEERTLTFLSTNGVEVTGICNQVDSSGNNLLHIEAQRGNLATLKYFLQLEIDINAPNSDGNTPLHLAVISDRGNVLDMAKLLVMHGADSNIENNLKLTPLLILAQNYTRVSNIQFSASSSIDCIQKKV